MDHTIVGHGKLCVRKVPKAHVCRHFSLWYDVISKGNVPYFSWRNVCDRLRCQFCQASYRGRFDFLARTCLDPSPRSHTLSIFSTIPATNQGQLRFQNWSCKQNNFNIRGASRQEVIFWGSLHPVNLGAWTLRFHQEDLFLAKLWPSVETRRYCHFLTTGQKALRRRKTGTAV